MTRILSAIMALLLTVVPAAVQAKSFYEGKTVTYIVATNPGGGYDTYARLLAKYLEKHLGARVIVKNVPGAGHIVGTNMLYASKPDGLTIGTFNTGLIYAQLLGHEGVQFDLSKMEWIGKAAADTRALVLGREAGFASFEDLARATRPVKFATAGVGSASYTDTKLIAAALDLKIDVVPGFNGSQGEMAMLRGEIGGHVGSMSSLRPFVDNGYGTFALMVGGTPEDGIPQASSFAKSRKGKSILNLVEAMSQLGRLTAAPPGTPSARVGELRLAYLKAVSDPGLLAEAKLLEIPVEPAIGREVEKMVKKALGQNRKTVDIIRAAVEAKAELVTVRTPLRSVTPDGKKIEFVSGRRTVKAKVSGSRTDVRIDGASANRKALKAGMSCRIAYDPQHEDNEPKLLDCRS